MASLHRYRNRGPWYLNYWSNGRHVVRSTHTEDFAEAMKAKLAEEAGHIRAPRPGVRWDRIGLDKAPRSPETLAKRREMLASYAHSVLASEPERFAYLLTPPRPTLLAHLGRVGDPELTRKIADYICTEKLTVMKGRAFISHTIMRNRPATPLYKAITNAITQWGWLHPREFLTANIAETLAGLAIDYRELARQKQQIAA